MNPKIKVGSSKIEGKGLFAIDGFKRGERFTVTDGEHPSVEMTDEEFQAYIKTVPSYDAVHLGNGRHRVSTASRDDDPSAYGNHSCDPNIGPSGDGVVAVRDIQPGEELTIDDRQMSPKSWAMKCNCEASTCSGKAHGRL